MWTPLIWIADGAAAAVDAVGGDIELHGYTLWCQRFVFLSSPLFAFGAVLLARRMARTLVGGSWAPTYAAVAVLLGTSLVYYATYMPSYAHAMDAFACTAFLCYWTETVGRSDARRWLALGALLGAATLVRTQELALGVVVAFECVASAARARSLRGAARWLGGGALALAATLVVMIPQLLEWQIVFGTMTALPQGARYTRPEAPMLAELLWSARNGWFTATPLAYLAVIGFAAYAARARDVRAGGLVAALVVQLYLEQHHHRLVGQLGVRPAPAVQRDRAARRRHRVRARDREPARAPARAREARARDRGARRVRAVERADREPPARRQGRADEPDEVRRALPRCRARRGRGGVRAGRLAVRAPGERGLRAVARRRARRVGPHGRHLPGRSASRRSRPTTGSGTSTASGRSAAAASRRTSSTGSARRRRPPRTAIATAR